MLYTYLVKIVYISFGVGLFIIELWVFGDTSKPTGTPTLFVCISGNSSECLIYG